MGCENENIGCPAPSDQPTANCFTREQWSDEKRAWCCENENIGCDHGDDASQLVEPILIPTPRPTYADASGCTLTGREVVAHGWSGSDSGTNWCNLCSCSNGNLLCTLLVCPEPHRRRN